LKKLPNLQAMPLQSKPSRAPVFVERSFWRYMDSGTKLEDNTDFLFTDFRQCCIEGAVWGFHSMCNH